MSVSAQSLTRISDDSQLVTYFGAEAEQEAAKAEARVGRREAESVVKEELRRCRTAIAERNIGAILKLASGKALLKGLLPRTGCKTVLNYARAVTTHLSVDDFDHLCSLRESLRSLIPPQE